MTPAELSWDCAEGGRVALWGKLSTGIHIYPNWGEKRL